MNTIIIMYNTIAIHFAMQMLIMARIRVSYIISDVPQEEAIEMHAL